MSRLIFHSCVLLFNLYTIWYDQTYVDMPFPVNIQSADLMFKARHIFLTHWCFILQTAYFALATLNDLVGTNAPNPTNSTTRKAKDVMFTLAFPLATYVAVTFWAIYAVDRELIFPTAFDAIIPWWINHAMHTFIFVFIFIELVTSFRAYPPRKFGTTIVAVFMAIYITWVNCLYFNYDIWVYPVLDVMNWLGRIAFFSFSTILAIGLYEVGDKLNSLFWSRRHVCLSAKNK